MAALNLTPSSQSTFILNGTLDLEAVRVWISIPYSMFYILSLLGNSIVIFVVSKEQTLHNPMYLLLCMLALTDIGLSTFTVPNTLSLLWFHLKMITVNGCLIQIFFLNVISGLHSAVLVTMAFDRYVAICDPLRYATIFTNARIAKVGLLGLIQALLLAFPLLLLLKNLPSCANHVIPHISCAFMTLVKMSCAETTLNWMYSIIITFMIIVLDLTFIGISYGLIVRSALQISSKKAYQKALNTCTTHISLMLIFFTPFLLYILTEKFGQGISDHVRVLLVNFYLLLPPVLNPIIYGIKNKELSHKLGRYICRI